MTRLRFLLAVLGLAPTLALAQPDGGPGQQPPPPQGGGQGGPSRMMRGGGPGGAERKLVKQFDKDGDKRLNAAERAAARAFLQRERENADDDEDMRPFPGGPGGQGGPGGFGPPGGPGGMRGGPGGPGGMGGENEPVKPGTHITPADVKPNTTAPLYDNTVLRTMFLEFENSDWEAELADFYNTDVEVPAMMTVDGVKYPNVGVSFRGASSFFTVAPGHKRSFNISMDFADPKQRLYGHKTLNLLNSHGDPSFMSSVLYAHIAREHIPAPRANHAVVVVNGESWGVYVNVEQFNKDFVAENYPKSGGEGARWKVKGRPNGDSGLRYTGDDIEQYKRRYTIKSKDDAESWESLVNLCRVLDKTPPDKLEAALKPILDVDGVLWFLALDVALANSDGYWTRASDYSIYRDANGVFHIIPHDMNEAFSPNLMMPGGGRGGRGGFGGGQGGPGGPGGQGDRGNRGGPDAGGPGEPPRRDDRAGAPGDQDRPRDPARQGPGGGGGGAGGRPNQASAYELDPLIGLNDAGKPLRSKLLAVPAFRAKYLANVRTIAEHDLNWTNLGPFVAQQRALIDAALEADTRKDTSITSFRRITANEAPAAQPPADAGENRPRRQGADRSLRTFADRRSAYLLKATDPSKPQEKTPAKPDVQEQGNR